MNSASQVSSVPVEVAPEVALSKDEYWQQKYAGQKIGPGVYLPKHYGGANWDIGKFFGVQQIKAFDSEYEAYLNNLNNRNEAKATQSARAWDEYMSNTAYSRAFEDLQRAGINPYMIVNQGSTPSTATGSSSKASYSAKSTQEAKTNNKGRDLALLLFAIARIAAFL